MTPPPEKRPFGLIVITGLLCLNFTIALITAFVLFGGLMPKLPQLVSDGQHLTAALVLLIDLWGLGIIYGLWRYRSWAWPVLMVQTGTNLLVMLFNYFEGHPHYLDMVVSVLIVFYLNQAEIRHRFLDLPPEPERL
jgi:hypothetical protein